MPQPGTPVAGLLATGAATAGAALWPQLSCADGCCAGGAEAPELPQLRPPDEAGAGALVVGAGAAGDGWPQLGTLPPLADAGGAEVVLLVGAPQAGVPLLVEAGAGAEVDVELGAPQAGTLLPPLV